MKILVVDDEKILRDLISMMLGDADHDILLATSGHDAMRVIDREPDIDVILLDVNCPSEKESGDDGIWLAEKLNERFSSRVKATPIFFMSAALSLDQEEKVKALAPLYPLIAKPIQNWGD